MNKPFLSIITPTYNREELILHTIDAALEFVGKTTYSVEIIVIDDASIDGTYDILQDRYRQELMTGEVKLIRNEKNLGVTGAKNLGASHADGEWLLFLDSDDLIIPEITKDILKTLQRNDHYCIIFFRSEELETGRLIGPYHQNPYELTLKDFLNNGTPGECLPVIKSSCFAQVPYYPELRGCEGLTYAHIIQKTGPARVETLVARRYRTQNDDRLSSKKGLIRRACHIEKYYRYILTDFYKYLSITMMAKIALKVIYYWLRCLIVRFRKENQ